MNDPAALRDLIRSTIIQPPELLALFPSTSLKHWVGVLLTVKALVKYHTQFELQVLLWWEVMAYKRENGIPKCSFILFVDAIYYTDLEGVVYDSKSNDIYVVVTQWLRACNATMPNNIRLHEIYELMCP